MTSKTLLCLISVVLLFAGGTASASDAAICAQTAAAGFPGLSSPGHQIEVPNEHRASVAAMSSTACYQGRDIALAVAGPGMVITSSIVMDSPSQYSPYGVFATEQAGAPSGASGAVARSEIVLIQVNTMTGQLSRKVVLVAKPSDDPNQTLFGFRIAGINSKKNTLYFEVPATATNDVLHVMELAADGTPIGQPKFFAVGHLDFVNDVGSVPGERDTTNFVFVAANGEAGEVVSLYKPNGDLVCPVDARSDDFRMNPVCTQLAGPSTVMASAAAPVVPQARGGQDMVNEMLYAAQLAVSTIKMSGANGLTQKINQCYQAHIPAPSPKFKCIYLDIAGRYIEQGFSQATNVPMRPFYSYDQTAARMGPVLAQTHVSLQEANEYLANTTMVIEKMVDADFKAGQQSVQ